jgi:TRAP-type C4-dicarboxylate transport system substrate-binding protein
MSKTYKQWIYHATEEPKVIDSDDFPKHESDGWKDSPATFTKIEVFGVDPEDTTKVHALGEAIEGVKERLNGELNIDIMTRSQCREYAKEHFNIDLNSKASIADLREEVRSLL